MTKYVATLAHQVSVYGTVEVEADSVEEASRRSGRTPPVGAKPTGRT